MTTYHFSACFVPFVCIVEGRTWNTGFGVAYPLAAVICITAGMRESLDAILRSM